VGWDCDIPTFASSDGPIATRKASARVINAISPHVFWLVGGSGDLAPSTKTLMEGSGDLERGAYGERNMHWGIREHVMCAASSGMALHGGVRPFAASFFIFTDYARAAIRLAALMELPVIYVLTHDSIGLGEDGPTHQPVEHLASFRAMPGMVVIRPGDANETAWAWRAAMLRRDGPTMLVLNRQKLPVLAQTAERGEGVLRGAYVLVSEKGPHPDVVLLATGSELTIALEARTRLGHEGIDARVVSMPSWELFRAQSEEYRYRVLPPDAPARVAVEAGVPQGWREWVGDAGSVVGVTRFGASAPWQEIYRHYGLTPEAVVERARDVLRQTHR
jgi:transketolase